MKHESSNSPFTSLLERLSALPHHLLRHHHFNHLAQCVLHTLGHHDHFSLVRAAYLVDNPDFNCIKGSAGYMHGELAVHPRDLFDDLATHQHHVAATPFYTTVRALHEPSIKRHTSDVASSGVLREICKRLGVHNPDCMVWPLKHGNWGVLLVEHEGECSAQKRQLLHNSAALLGFCPVPE